MRNIINNPIMNLPKPRKVNVELYAGGISKFKDIDNPIKLSANESALGPSPKVIEFLKSNIALNRYPDGNGLELKEIIAKKFNLSKEQIILGAGSDEIISLACQAFLEKGDEVIASENSFLMYRIYSQLNDAKVKFSKLVSNCFSVTETLKCVTEKTKIVFIANPNNPTGTYISAEQLLELREKLSSEILLMVDDAYAEYVSEKDFKSGLDLFRDSKNTIVSRTFSKIFGLANLRLGWGVASSDIIKALNVFRPPFNISGIAEKAGCIAINDDEWIEKNIKHNEKWSKIFYEKLLEKKIICNLPVANFFLMNFDNAKLNSDNAFELFATNKILLRKMKSYGIDNSLRVTIGNDLENEKFIKILEENF